MSKRRRESTPDRRPTRKLTGWQRPFGNYMHLFSPGEQRVILNVLQCMRPEAHMGMLPFIPAKDVRAAIVNFQGYPWRRIISKLAERLKNAVPNSTPEREPPIYLDGVKLRRKLTRRPEEGAIIKIGRLPAAVAVVPSGQPGMYYVSCAWDQRPKVLEWLVDNCR